MDKVMGMRAAVQNAEPHFDAALTVLRFEKGFRPFDLIQAYHPHECGIDAFVADCCAPDIRAHARAVLQDYVRLTDKHWPDCLWFYSQQPVSSSPVIAAEVVEKYLESGRGRVNPKRAEELRLGLTDRLRAQLFREALRGFL
jgi:hypothetical protein